MLGLDKAGWFVRADPVGVGGARRLKLRLIPGSVPRIASVPGASWVVTYTPAKYPRYGAAPTRLAMVDPSKVTPFGPAYPVTTPVTALAVNQTGTLVALG